VLEKLPSPEPDDLPAPLSRGSVWEIDAQSGRIQSSYIGSRYEIHYSGTDLDRVKKWEAEQAKATSAAEGA
jgi:hypothetical protein